MVRLSEAFTQASATSAFLGGACLGLLAAGRMWCAGKLLPSSTFHPVISLSVIGTSLALAAAFPEFGAMFEAESLAMLDHWRVGVAAVLVGLGATMGCGCTCGNGIQGLSSLSTSSLGFVATFMASGAATATLAETSDVVAPGQPIAWIPWAILAVSATAAFSQFFLGNARLAKVAEVAAGVSFSCALLASGMVKPSKVVAFLDFTNEERGWDPSLAFVMGGAISVALPLFQGFALVKSADENVRRWAVRPLDLGTIVGGVLFGTGWGLCGICPGPAMVSCATISPKVLLFTGLMFGSRQVISGLRAAALGPADKRS